MINDYLHHLQTHYENYFGLKGTKTKWPIDPNNRLNKDFYVLEFEPNAKHKMWTYCTVGMSFEKSTGNKLIELFIFSPFQDQSLTELLTLVSSYNRNYATVDLYHTFNIGRPWLNGSKCDYGFVSLPYLDGTALELFNFNEEITHCYWLIPITEAERNYKIEHGFEALEQLFEDKQVDYLNPKRMSLI